MGGDLRIENQKDWLTFLGDRMHDLLDAYSVHIYWSYVEPRDASTGSRAGSPASRRSGTG